MLATIVEWDALFKVVWMSLAGTIGITLAFSLAIVGATGFSESRRDGRVARATAFGALAALALALCVAATAFGLYEMTSKE